jgi:hypothetical protein
LGKTSEASVALAEAFFRSMPASGKKRMSETEWASALEKFHRVSREIRRKYRLGLLSRALVTYQFQKHLMTAGLDADVVRKVVFSLVLNAFVSS